MSSQFHRSNVKRKKGLPSIAQLKKIQGDFPNVKIVKQTRDSFQIELQLQPSPISLKYDIRITYEKNERVKVFVINERLKIAPNREKLPHVYDGGKQQLCLYSSSKKEWNGFKPIADTIIPWTSEWLFYYELWLLSGQWYGGGHDEYSNKEF
ncbi:MAG: hypothetical protein OXE77_01800 [Flavobacteriaceae bacterium]|nr:hypothetical protein [Flavobacteriaceae bacterium]MCY4299653.1 hypothetical protein [Flavobacteriaceae bacterium]